MREINFIITLVLFVMLSGYGYAGNNSILPAPKQVSKHVFAWIGPHEGPNVKNKGYRMNMAFVVGKHSVAVLESGYYPEMAEAMITHIKAITDKPIKYVINSNSQPDRFYGNAAFHKRGIKTYAHAEEIKRMNANANNYALMHEMVMKFKNARLPEPAQNAINKPVSFDLGGGVVIDVSFHKAAHTPLPLIVHVKSDNVVYAGDILYSGRLLAIVNGGNIKQWRETFNYLKKYKDATFIPGHGQPAKLSAFEKSTYEYLTLLDLHMSKMLEEDIDMQDAMKRLDQSTYSYLENYKQLAGKNANRAYQEAERAAF